MKFKPHPAQLRALEAIESGRRVMLRGGQASGRRRATEMAIIANASSADEARLCLEDLDKHGIALQGSDGRRIDPKPKASASRRFVVRFDEQRKR